MKLLIQERRLHWSDRLQVYVSYFLILVMLITALVFFSKQDWLLGVLTIGIIFLSLLPALIRKNYRVFLPVEFDLLTIVFIFAALFLGEIHAYYTMFWWWDVVLHTLAGFLIGLAGFILVYVLNKERKISLFLKPGFVALFSFAFAITISVLWEIFEFALDSFFGFNMQKSGLADTMWDLIVDTLGAVVIAIIGYFYVKKEKGSLLFDHLVKRFVEKNPRLFKDKKNQ